MIDRVMIVQSMSESFAENIGLLNLISWLRQMIAENNRLGKCQY